MIKRELAKDPKLAEENWERFLPKFRRRREKKKGGADNEGGYEAGPSGSNAMPIEGEDGQPPMKKQKKANEKKVYTPFPPAQQPSKVSSMPVIPTRPVTDAGMDEPRSIFNSNLESTSSSLERSNNGRKRREKQRCGSNCSFI